LRIQLDHFLAEGITSFSLCISIGPATGKSGNGGCQDAENEIFRGNLHTALIKGK
jgi:hypothetical protein